jgi:hypothetical protein
MGKMKDLYTTMQEALQAQDYAEIISYLTRIIPDEETRALVLWEALKALAENANR